jgi:hypothetical protein
LMLFMELFLLLLLLLLIIDLRCSIQVGKTGYKLEGRDLILCNRNFILHALRYAKRA